MESAMKLDAGQTSSQEFRAGILSSIINLVCPVCGGAMMGYQCYGQCRRNWVAAWKWAKGTSAFLESH